MLKLAEHKIYPAHKLTFISRKNGFIDLLNLKIPSILGLAILIFKSS